MDTEIYQKLKWLIFFRILFTTLLLGSTMVLQLGGEFSPLSQPLVILYELITFLYILSFVYAVLLPRIRRLILFAYIQILVDTVIVTMIIFLTGSFSSLFSFLYLVIIIYASMLLFRRGSMIMAAVCSIQYGVLVDLEYYAFIRPLGTEANLLADNVPWSFVLYRILITIVGCFAVAFLSGFLAEQARNKEKELRAMEAHMKRVQKMAAIGEMAAGLAHEVKNPLASLRGSIQLLEQSEEVDAYQQKLMNIILREADRLNSLVNDFLMFAKPPSGKAEIISLKHTLNEIITMFEKDDKCKNQIMITSDLSPEIWVEMDSGHLRQILWNLLLNAQDSIVGKGEIHIRLESRRGRFGLIEIRDTGCGMSPEVIQKIFDPFVTSKSDGTGLGLSIVHRIIESYDARLDVESEEGKGSVFTIRLKQIPPPEDGL